MNKAQILSIALILPLFLGMAFFQWWVRDFELMPDAKIYAYFNCMPRDNMFGMQYNLMQDVKELTKEVYIYNE